MKKWLLSLLLGLCLLPGARADEGMWLIQSLDRALEKNMKARGLKLGAREIYNEEAGGLSDAVVSLGFYCTGSMISEDGLLITNHHCTFRQVSELSTPDTITWKKVSGPGTAPRRFPSRERNSTS